MVARQKDTQLPCGEAFDYPEASNVWHGHFKSKHKVTYNAEQEQWAVSTTGSVGATTKQGGAGGWLLFEA